VRRAGLLLVGPVLALVACAGPFASDDGPAGVAGDPTPPAGAFEATVVRVVDGDTLIARRDGDDLRVRLIGIDAPESVQPDAPVECFGRRASQELAALLPVGTTVRAAYESGGRQDQYGRELWDVWTPGGAFVQARLVRRGLAEARAYRPQTEHAEHLDGLERTARADATGLWGACGP
jgi:micrococcal nuclease